MTSHPRTRYLNAARYVASQLERTATVLEQAPTECPHAIANNILVAIELRRLSRITLGDIGEETKEIEAEPLEIPTTIPQQVPVPA